MRSYDKTNPLVLFQKNMAIPAKSTTKMTSFSEKKVYKNSPNKEELKGILPKESSKDLNFETNKDIERNISYLGPDAWKENRKKWLQVLYF